MIIEISIYGYYLFNKKGSVETPPLLNEKPAEVMDGSEQPLKVFADCTLSAGHMTLFIKLKSFFKLFLSQIQVVKIKYPCGMYVFIFIS
jgi:hypothetical protein